MLCQINLKFYLLFYKLFFNHKIKEKVYLHNCMFVWNNIFMFHNMASHNCIFLLFFFIPDNVVLSGYGSQASSKKMTGFGYSIKTESNFIY